MNPAAGPVLRDIHLPPPPSWWPPAPGWWVLFILCLICVFLALWTMRKIARRRRIRRGVLGELDRCIDTAKADPAALAAALSQFLRRMALRESSPAAAYEGRRWLEHLDRQCAGDEFSQGIGRVLIEAPFRPAMQYDAAALIALVRRYTRNALDAGFAHV